MINIRNLILLCTLLAGAACQQMNDQLLVGKWQATELLEENTPVDINTNEISFEFREDQNYAYQSTLNYREAGEYAVEGPYLYTTDTLNQASTEKAVEIILLTEDSLYLRMQQNGKERLLKLIRQQ